MSSNLAASIKQLRKGLIRSMPASTRAAMVLNDMALSHRAQAPATTRNMVASVSVTLTAATTTMLPSGGRLSDRDINRAMDHALTERKLAEVFEVTDWAKIVKNQLLKLARRLRLNDQDEEDLFQFVLTNALTGIDIWYNRAISGGSLIDRLEKAHNNGADRSKMEALASSFFRQLASDWSRVRERIYRIDLKNRDMSLDAPAPEGMGANPATRMLNDQRVDQLEDAANLKQDLKKLVPQITRDLQARHPEMALVWLAYMQNPDAPSAPVLAQEDVTFQAPDGTGKVTMPLQAALAQYYGQRDHFIVVRRLRTDLKKYLTGKYPEIFRQLGMSDAD
jgi:hypothetical protein